MGITAVFLMTVPLAHAPDDRTYVWSVEHFLWIVELWRLEWSAHYPLA